MNDLRLARATFAAAVKRWPDANNHAPQRRADHREDLAGGRLNAPLRIRPAPPRIARQRNVNPSGAACRNVLRPSLSRGRYRRREILRAPSHQGRTHQCDARRQRTLARRTRGIVQDFSATATNATGNARRASPLATASFNNCCSALRAARWPICGRTATAGLPRPQTGSVVASNRVLLVGTSRIVVGVFADANAPVNEGRGAP